MFFFLTVRNNYYIFELEYTIFKQRMILFKETVKKVVNTEKVISLRTILFFSDIPKFFIWTQTVSTVKGNKPNFWNNLFESGAAITGISAAKIKIIGRLSLYGR